MENEQFQKHILERVRKLEDKEFGATYEQQYTPRQQAEGITDGNTPHHIGKKSSEVLKQELISHQQSYRGTFTKDERKKWYEKRKSLITQLKEMGRD